MDLGSDDAAKAYRAVWALAAAPKQSVAVARESLKPVAAVEAGRQYNQLLASWKSGQPVPQQVVAAVQGIGAALSAVTADFPAGTTRTTILADLATAQGIFITTFEIVLAVKGGLQ